MTKARTVQYTLRANTSGVPGLKKLEESLERIFAVQTKLQQQGDVVRGLRDQTAAAVAAAQQEAQAARMVAAEKQKASNEYSSYRKRQISEVEAVERRAHQEGMERLRNANQTAILNARLSAQAESEARKAVRASMQERQELLTQVQLAHARARAEFDKEAGQAKNYRERTVAAQKYRQAVREIEEGMAALGKRTDLTSQQLKSLETLRGRLAREQNTLGGGVNALGLSGNVSNALGANLPRIMIALQNSVTALSPSLGAAAMNSGLLTGAFGGVAAAAGPMGIAVAGAVALITAGAAGIASSVNAYADLEKALNGLKASSGSNAGEMNALQSEAQNTATQYGLLTREVIAAQEELAKGGVSIQDIAGGATEAVTVLAKATGVTIRDAIGIAVPAMNVWSLKGEQMMQLADVISNGANKSALDVAGMAMSLQQAAGAAESAGLSFEQTTAVLALLADRGIQGSDAGTSLRTMLERLKSPTDIATEALNNANVAVFDQTGKQRDMIVVLGEVLGAMDKMTDQQRSAFAQTVFGTDAQRSLTAAWREGTGTLAEYIAATTESGSAQRNAETRMEGLRGAQERYNASLDLFKTKVGEYFAPAMTTLVETATDGIEKLNTLFDWLKRVRSEREAQEDTALEQALDAKRLELKTAENTLGGLRETRERQEAAGMSPAQNLIDKIDAAYARVQSLRTEVDEAAARAQRDRLERDRQAATDARNRPDWQGPVAGPDGGPSYVQPLAAQLGVGGFAISQEFGSNPFKHGYGARGHQGVDVATPIGTQVKASFDATVYTGFDKDGYGRYLKLVDEKGQALILAHLDSLDKALQEELRVYGTAKVKAGTLLARTGNTGNSTGPHLHMEGRTASGQAVDPRTLIYANTGTRPQLGGGGTSNAPGGTTGGTDEGPITAAQIIKAQQLSATVERAVAALQAKPGDEGLTRKVDAATQAVKRWSEANSGNARALAAVKQGQDGLKKSTDGYIASQADLRKYGKDALLLIKAQEQAYNSGSAQQRAAADRNIAAWEGESKARAAVLQVEKAAYQSRKQMASQDDGPITTAQITKAQQLTLAFDKAQEALRKNPGSPALIKSVDAAERAMRRWGEQTDSNARALTRVKDAQSGLKKSGDDYIANAKDFQKYGTQALLLIKEQERVQKTGTAAEREAVRGRVEAFRQQGKAQAAVLASEQAAYQSRQQAAQKSDAEAKTRAKNRADTQRALDQALAEGRDADARRLLDGLKTAQAKELALHKDDAARRAQIIEESGPGILAAEDKIANLRRDRRIKDAQRVANEAKALPGADLAAIEQTRRLSVAQAYKDAAAERAKARDQQESAERSAADAVAEADRVARDNRLARQKELNDRLARFAEAARQGRIADAKLELDGITTLRDQELLEAKDDAALRVRIEEDYAGRVRQIRRDLADAEYADAERDIQNQYATDPTNPLKSDALRRAGETRDQAYAAADRDSANRVNAALDSQTDKVRSLRDQYSQLADGIREKITAQKVDQNDLSNYLQRLGELDTAILSAGVGNDRFLQSARATAQALYDEALDAQIASGAFSDLADTHDRAARATLGYSVTLEDALAQIPGGTEATDAYLRVLEDLAREGKVAADVVKAVKQAVADRTVVWQLEAEEIERVSQEALAQADALAELGDTEGAVDGLSVTLAGLYDRMAQGQDVAAAIGLVIDKINALSDALNLDTEFGSFVAGLGGTLSDQIDAVISKIAETTEPKLKARLQAYVADLRGQLAQAYPTDAASAGYIPGANGFVPKTGGVDYQAIARARDLGAALAGPSDPDAPGLSPAELQGIIGETVEFLASEVGQALPEATRKGLEDGVRDAQAFVAILADITAEGVTDGFDRAKDAAAPPTNRFDELNTRLTTGDLKADAADPERHATLIAGLEAIRQAGELTDAQLVKLKKTLGELGGDQTRLKAVQDEMDALTASLNVGSISLEDFAGQAGPLTVKLERLAVAAERNKNPALAAQYRDLAANLRNLIPVIVEVTDELDDLSKGAASVGDGAASIFNAFGMGDFAKLSSGLGNVFKAGLDIKTSIGAVGPAFQKSFGAGVGAVGGVFAAIGAGISVVMQVGDAIEGLHPGLQKWKKSLQEVADAQKAAMGPKQINNWLDNPYHDVLKEDAAAREKMAGSKWYQRLWWNVTGGGPKYMSDEAAKLKIKTAEIFSDLGADLANTMENELMNGFDAGDFSKVNDKLDAQLDRFIARMTLQAIFARSKLKELVAAYAEEAARGGDTSDELAAIRAERDRVTGEATGVLSGLPGYGSGQSAGSGTGDPASNRQRQELWYQYEQETDPVKKAELRKQLEGGGSSGGAGGSTVTITREAVSTDWGALTTSITLLADRAALFDQAATIQMEAARLQREAAGINAQAAGLILLAAERMQGGAPAPARAVF